MSASAKYAVSEPLKSNPPPPRPFLKWVGGKGRLLEQFQPLLPKGLRNGDLCYYAEPFLGGGALFFHLAGHSPIQQFFLSDINSSLIGLYRILQLHPDKLLIELEKLSSSYLPLNDKDRKAFFLRNREQTNQLIRANKHDSIPLAASLIFLNRTCYNGLFRMNSSGAFNAPHGRYKNPRIADRANLIASALLKKATLSTGDFTELGHLLQKKKIPLKETFIYFDPPYLPVSKTSHFTAYSRAGFTEKDQVRLSELFAKLHHRGAKLMLSNSDPGNNFFEKLYQDSHFHFHRVQATRSINSKGDQRGPLSELVITNY